MEVCRNNIAISSHNVMFYTLHTNICDVSCWGCLWNCTSPLVCFTFIIMMMIFDGSISKFYFLRKGLRIHRVPEWKEALKWGGGLELQTLLLLFAVTAFLQTQELPAPICSLSCLIVRSKKYVSVIIASVPKVLLVNTEPKLKCQLGLTFSAIFTSFPVIL